MVNVYRKPERYYEVRSDDMAMMFRSMKNIKANAAGRAVARAASGFCIQTLE